MRVEVGGFERGLGVVMGLGRGGERGVAGGEGWLRGGF